MKAFVIVGILILASVVIFIRFVQITKPDGKKLKVVHRGDDELAG